MAKTVVGMFKSTGEAHRVKEELVAEGFESRNITVMSQDEYSEGTIHTGYDQGYGITGESVSGSDYGSESGSESGRSTETHTGAHVHEGVGQKISHFFKSLVGEDDDDRGHQYYRQGIEQGGAVLVATVHQDEADEVAQIMRQHGARNVDEENATDSGMETERMRSSSSSGQSRDDARTDVSEGRNLAQDEQTVPVVEEELQVGKRTVNRGGVRVYTHVVERPVDQNITLREEHLRIERRPVDRAASSGDLSQENGVIEVVLTGEEPVVGKTSRVVEEVVIGKETTERTEAIHDTVRRKEVQVEKVGEEENDRARKAS